MATIEHLTIVKRNRESAADMLCRLLGIVQGAIAGGDNKEFLLRAGLFTLVSEFGKDEIIKRVEKIQKELDEDLVPF